MATTEMSAAIKAYSNEVTPDSSLKKRVTKSAIASTLSEGARRTAAARTALPYGAVDDARCLASSVLESGSESVANPIVDSQQLLAGKRHRGDADDRDQRGNQAIFNGSDAGFIV